MPWTLSMSAQPKQCRAVSVPPPSPGVQSALGSAARALATARRVLIVSHTTPDGDAVASSLALYWLVTALGNQALVANQDPVPAHLAFLPGANQMRADVVSSFGADLVCVLDTSDPSRLGSMASLLHDARRVLVIDHHRDPWSGDGVVLQDSSAAATAELIYRLAVELDAPVDARFGECVYCALLSDTGSFRYRSTTPAALSIAGAALAFGVDPWHVASHVYETQPIERVELLGDALRSLRRTDCGRLATIVLERSALERVGADDEMVDGIINHVRAIRGVEMAVQLYEVVERRFVITFRSRGNLAAGPLARRVGGRGGRFSGQAILDGTPEQVAAEIQSAFADELDSRGGIASVEAHPSSPEGS